MAGKESRKQIGILTPRDLVKPPIIALCAKSTYHYVVGDQLREETELPWQ